MSEKALTRRETAPLGALDASTIEAVVATGDLLKLTAEQRTHWYLMRCEAAGLDPRTQPFKYITFQGKLTLYPRKAATEQLAEKRGISLEILTRGGVAGELYEAVIRATDAGGRYTDEIGLVSIQGKRGDDLANAMMKAVTKAKRRAILSLSGLGMLDETEIETIPDARPVRVDPQTGEVLQPARPALAQGQVVDVSSRVSRAMETQSSYAESVGLPAAVPETPASAAQEVKSLLQTYGAPTDRKAHLGAILGRGIADFKKLTAADWSIIRDDLRAGLPHQKRAFALFNRLHPGADEETRKRTFAEALGLPALATSADLTPAQWELLGDVLAKQPALEASVEAELVDVDPFAAE